MNENFYSKNLEELLVRLIDDQIDIKASTLIKEIISIQKNNKNSNTEKINNSNSILIILKNYDFIEFSEENKKIDIKIQNILNILLYPRYLYFINSIYGPKILQIIEKILQCGYCNINSNILNEKSVEILLKDNLIIKNGENYKLNYNLLNEIIFKDYIVNFYKKYISMNFEFYDLFKKVINSKNFEYEKENNKCINNDNFCLNNFDYNNLILNEEKKFILNKDIIKYDLYYNAIEKLINIKYTPKHIRILKIIQRNININLMKLSQLSSLKIIEIKEILNDLIDKEKLISENKNMEAYTLNPINFLNIVCLKDKIYGVINNVKFELKDKLKELKGRISKETEIQYINKYYSLVNYFAEILNAINFLFK